MAKKTDKDLSSIITSTTIKLKSRKKPTQCKICEAPAIYSFFGVIVCPSCKVFFKRNAENKQKQFKCHFDGHCEITLNTRHVCSHCRLAKCFEQGMQVELLRGSSSKRKKELHKKQKKSTNNQITTVANNSNERIQPQQLFGWSFPPSNQSKLSTDQWNLLSNLLQCYDETNCMTLVQQFLVEQNNLPPKMRFKLASINDFLFSFAPSVQLLFEKNADFLSLCSHDRSVLLRSTIKQVTGVSFSFLVKRCSLADYPAFCNAVVRIYGADVFDNALRASRLIDSDVVVVKLILSILIFIPCDFTIHRNDQLSKLRDVQSILHFQNVYLQLAYRYLLYRYDYQRAISCFSALTRCLFVLNRTIEAAGEVEEYNKTIEALIKQTEESLTMCE